MDDATASPEANPPGQADGLFQPGGADHLWYVVHTKPRCEKKASKTCLDREICHYLPLHQNRPKRSKGQRRYSFDVPLLPGYIFACCNSAERLELLCSGYLVRTLEVVDQALLLGELRQIYLASSGFNELNFYPQLKRGRSIRVVRGPLQGVSGKISSRKETYRIVLNISILGTAVAAEVDMDDVELL
jgi:transcription antitermination factor NusG